MLTRTWLAAGLTAFALAFVGVGDGLARAGSQAPPIDILLAFDTTASMDQSIGAAQREASSLITAVDALAPGTHWAVASFRDRFYPGGEYTLLSPMTVDRTKIAAALKSLKPVLTNNIPADTNAEAYNLMFHESYADPHVDWRGGSRKLVVVIGDAEPHSAGTDGLPGCNDTTHDWDGLDTAHELAAMQAAKRTLVMIRQVTSSTSTSLACYSSLAERTYAGGSAVDADGTNVVQPVVQLVKRAFAPLTLVPQLTRGVSGLTDGLTVGIANPNSYPLAITALSVTLPPGVTFVPGSQTGSLPAPVLQGGQVTWQRSTPLRAGEALLAHVVLRLGKISSATVQARLQAATPDGAPFVVNSAASLQLVPHAHVVTVTADGSAGPATITGRLQTTLAASSRRVLGSAAPLVLQYRSARSVTLRATSGAASSLGAPSALTVQVSVTRSSMPGCRPGTSGVLHILDSDRLTRGLRTHDQVSIKLPASCGGGRTFADAAPGQHLELKLGFG